MGGEMQKTAGQIINELPMGQFVTLEKVIPHGGLQARRLASGGVHFYWRVKLDGKSIRESIGTYDPSAPPKSLNPTAKGYSVKAAVRAAEVLAQKHNEHLPEGGISGAKQAEEQAKEEKKKEADLASKQTLERLLFDYCDHLEALGRKAHRDARSIFSLHVVQPWPQLACLPAKMVTVEQVADMMRLVRDQKKGRTANKLRSYIRAAYTTAQKARSSNNIPVHFKAYKVTSNPAADTAPDEAANRADKNPLSLPELRTYWQCIKNLPGTQGALLRLHLLTGGQRIAQLVSLKTRNCQPEQITLFDGKGRPGKDARPHSLPLIPAASQALEELHPTGEWALSSDKGISHIAPTTLSKWAVTAAGDKIADFSTKRIRSGVETALASARISQEIRGRIQSHGIAGVQARHYDGHEYMDEKREALETLFKLLTESTVAKPAKSAKASAKSA